MQSTDWEKDITSFKELVKGAIEVAHGMLCLKHSYLYYL